MLIWKRLEGAKFKWPAISDGVMRLSAAQLVALFEGLEACSTPTALITSITIRTSPASG